MNERLVFNFDSETSTRAMLAALTRHGLSAQRSFNLQSALGAHNGCNCPHHGTARCNCQFTVLLVYRARPASQAPRVGEAAEPLVLTTHSRDNQTEARIVHDATITPDPRLAEVVMTALVEAALTLQKTPSPSASETPAQSTF